MPWGAVLSAGASLLGGAMGADATKDAANQQTQAAANSVAEQRRQYNQTRADNAPFLSTGVAANKRLAQLLGLGSPADKVEGMSKDDFASHYYGVGYGALNPSQQSSVDSRFASEGTQGTGEGELTRKFTSADLNADPVYNSGLQFGLSEGEKGINARATQAGGYDSGATLKALTRFGNDYGSTKAADSYNRFTNDQNNVFNKLSGVSGTGQVANSQVTSAGTNMANNVSNTMEGAGNANAASIVGGANAWGNAFGGVSNAVNGYQNSQILQKLLAGGKTGGATTSAAIDPSWLAG